MINLGNGKYRPLEEINSGLKLQELVKKEIIKCKENAGDVVYGLALEHLLKDSKK